MLTKDPNVQAILKQSANSGHGLSNGTKFRIINT